MDAPICSEKPQITSNKKKQNYTRNYCFKTIEISNTKTCKKNGQIQIKTKEKIQTNSKLLINLFSKIKALEKER
jgi:hypothetical protein